MTTKSLGIWRERFTQSKGSNWRSVSMLALFFVVGCTQLSLSQTLTPGDRFRQRMAALEAQCRRDPPSDPRNTRCRPLQIKPEDWLATPEGRFAHSIRIPNPVPADSGYRPGMTPVEYFEHLCKNEAGEFIFKTVENVEGIRLLRLREPADDYLFQDLYAMEDPYGHWQGDAEEPGFQFVGPSKYAYIETPLRKTKRNTAYKEFRHSSLYTAPEPGQTLERYFGYDDRSGRSLQLEYDNTPRSRHAATWRGIKRQNDREMGIAGGELIVLDVDTNEVLAVRRGYALYRGSWELTPVCPKYGYFGGFDKDAYFSFWFAGKVARPPNWAAFAQELEKYRKAAK